MSTTPPSLHLRLASTSLLVLIAFLGLAGWTLDRAYRESTEKALQEQLQGLIYALLAAADEDAQGRMRLPHALPDPRLGNPDSGLYARVTGEDGGYQWKSASLLGRSMKITQNPAPGQWLYQKPACDTGLYTLGFSIIWEDKQGAELLYTLVVGAEIAPLSSQIRAFRNTLWGWLGGVALLLILVQGIVLHWGLKPLRNVTRELHRIKNGKTNHIAGKYPIELQQLTANINALIHHSQASQQRYRNSLDDLAHSLKTPLTVLQGATETRIQNIDQFQATLTEQLSRMDEIIQHQLQKASSTGQTVLGKATPVTTLVSKILNALDKIYQDKGIRHTVAIEEQLSFFGAEGDLMEILGNLLENAYKYGKSRVHISATEADDALTIQIEDDGCGIPADKVDSVLKRGQRIDERQPGQGIGLSAAYEVIHLYQGELKIDRSSLGGAKITLTFPRLSAVI